MIKKAFHPKAMMYGTSPGNVTIIEIEGLYSYVDSKNPPSKTGEPHQSIITSIHFTGHAASVEMVETSAYGCDYTNYFQLLKIEGT
jgi:Putative lumazine-binding